MRAARAAAIVLLAGLLLSCGDARDRETLRFWNGFTGPDGRAMLRIVQGFNEQHDDARVLMQRMDWGTYYNKVFVAGLGGRAPDVFVVHVDQLPRFARAGLVADMEELLADEEGWEWQDVDASVLAQARVDGALAGLPLDVHMLGLYYNEALFVDAGLVDDSGAARVPTNGDEFLAALEAFKARADAGGPVQWGFVITWFRTNAYTLMAQNGGAMIDEDGRWTLSDARNVEALEYLVGLVRERGLVPPPENFDSWIGFRQGRVAMAFEGVYMLADLQKTEGLDYKAAPVPTLLREPAAWASSHVLCARAGMDAERRSAAARFIRHLSDNSLDWAEGGQVPTRISLRDSERFRAMEVPAQFARQIDVLAFPPQVEHSVEFWQQFDLAVERALRGSATPQEALLEAEQRLEELRERRRATR